MDAWKHEMGVCIFGLMNGLIHGLIHGLVHGLESAGFFVPSTFL